MRRRIAGPAVAVLVAVSAGALPAPAATGVFDPGTSRLKMVFPRLSPAHADAILAELRALKTTMVDDAGRIRDVWDSCYVLAAMPRTPARVVVEGYFPHDGRFTDRMVADVVAALRTRICPSLPADRHRPACTRGSFRHARGDRVAVRIRTLGESPAHRDRYTGVRVCDGPRQVLVFRMLLAADFDRAVRRVDSGGLRVRLAPAGVTREFMRAVGRRARAEQDALRSHGARLVSVRYEPEGFVRLGVSGDLDAARRVLRRLEAMPYVVVARRAPLDPL